MKKLTVPEARTHPYYYNFKKFNVPIGFLGAEFDDYNTEWLRKDPVYAESNAAGYARYCNYLDNIDKMIEEGKGLFLSGSFGIGKTMLMTIAFKRAIDYMKKRPREDGDMDRQFTMGWVTGAYMVTLFTFGSEQNEERREKLPNLDILAIDELKKIRVRLSHIYMKLGNPNDCDADMVLNEDIQKFKERIDKGEFVKQ